MRIAQKRFFLELLIGGECGATVRLESDAARASDNQTESSSNAPKAHRSTKKRRMLNDGELRQMRRGDRGKSREAIFHTSSTSPRPGQLRGSPGRRAFCSSDVGDDRKGVKRGNSFHTAPAREGHFKSRLKRSK